MYVSCLAFAAWSTRVDQHDHRHHCAAPGKKGGQSVMTSALLKRTIVLGLHFRPNVFSSTSKLSGFGGRGGGGRHHHYHHHQQLQLLLRRSYRNESNYVHTCKRHVSKRAKRIASSLESSDEAALASSSSVTNGSKKLEENSSTSTSSQNLASSPPGMRESWMMTTIGECRL